MQGSSFRKNKVGWIQETMRNLASSSLLCKPISHPQTPLRNSAISCEVKAHQKILRPPELSIRLDAKLVQRLQDRLQRSRKTVHGILATNQLTTSFDNFVELKTEAEEDIGSLQQAEGAFCVGIVLLKGEGDSDATRRLREQLRRCCQRGGAIFSSNSSTSLLPQIQRALVRQMRLFLLLQQTREGLGVGQMLFFPRANISLKKIKLTPFSFTVNQVLNQIISTKDIKNDINFGFISLNKATQGSKFILLDRNQPQLHRNCPPLLGVWAFGKVNGGQQKQTLIWSLIMEYVTNPHISQRLSFQGQRTGLFFFFDQKKTNDGYLFQFPNNAAWNLVHNYQIHQRLPEQYHFSHKEVIHEEEREQSETQSISKMRSQPFPFSQPSYDPGVVYQQQLQEKDAQIRRLTVELEFYKTQCTKLQQALANMNIFGMTAKALASISPMNAFSPKQVPSPMTSSFGHEAPFFGHRQANCIEFQIQQPSNNRKQFSVKDLKNISFAQENEFQEDFNMDCQRMLGSPQFKEKEIIVPDRKKEIEEKEEFRVMKQKSFEFGFKPPQQQLGGKSQSISEINSQKNNSQLKVLEDKYGNNSYQRTSKEILNSPKGKETVNTNEIDKPKTSKQTTNNIIKRQQQSRVNTFQQNPREKRIKNQMYSQQKINKTNKISDIIERSPLKGRFKEEEKNGQKEEVKMKQTFNNGKLQHKNMKSAAHNSSDEDQELKNIIKQKNLQKKRRENKELR